MLASYGPTLSHERLTDDLLFSFTCLEIIQSGHYVNTLHHYKINKFRNCQYITADTFLKYRYMYLFYFIYGKALCLPDLKLPLLFFFFLHWGSIPTQCPVSMERGENKEVW